MGMIRTVSTPDLEVSAKRLHSRNRSRASSSSNSRRISVRTDVHIVDKHNPESKEKIGKRRSSTPENKRTKPTASATSLVSVKKEKPKAKTTKTSLLRQRMASQQKPRQEPEQYQPFKARPAPAPRRHSIEKSSTVLKKQSIDNTQLQNPNLKAPDLEIGPIDKNALKLDFRSLHDEDDISANNQFVPTNADISPAATVSSGNAHDEIISPGKHLLGTRTNGINTQHIKTETVPPRKLATYSKESSFENHVEKSKSPKEHANSQTLMSANESIKSSKKLASYKKAKISPKNAGHVEQKNDFMGIGQKNEDKEKAGNSKTEVENSNDSSKKSSLANEAYDKKNKKSYDNQKSDIGSRKSIDSNHNDVRSQNEHKNYSTEEIQDSQYINLHKNNYNNGNTTMEQAKSDISRKGNMAKTPKVHAPLLSPEKLDTIKRYLEEQENVDQERLSDVQDVIERSSRCTKLKSLDPVERLAVVIEQITEEKRQLTDLCSKLLQEMQLIASKLVEIETRQEYSLLSLLPKEELIKDNPTKNNANLNKATQKGTNETGNQTSPLVCEKCQKLDEIEKVHLEYETKMDNLQSTYKSQISELNETIMELKAIKSKDTVSTSVQTEQPPIDVSENSHEPKDTEHHHTNDTAADQPISQENAEIKTNIQDQSVPVEAKNSPVEKITSRSAARFSERFDILQRDNEFLKKQLQALQERCDKLAELIKSA